MRFNISSAELLKCLTDVSKAVPAKSPIPILENLLFVLKGEKLEITASDSELTLRTLVEVEQSGEDGGMAVPARHMTELLKSLPDQPIEIATVGDSSFECRWSTGNSTLPYFPAEDFPEIKGVGENAVRFTIGAHTLSKGIVSTVYAAADDEMRPQMNGIFFDLDTASSTLVASDSHKLICYSADGVNIGEKTSFILHKKPAAVLAPLLEREEGDVEVSFDENNAVFHFSETLMICRLVVGKFPRYRDVIPQNNASILRIDRQMLLSTVKRVTVCANKASNVIKLTLGPGTLEMSAQDLGFNIAAYEKLPCEYDGEDLTIGFKSQFLTEILANMNCETVVMKFSDARRAALIIPSEEEEESGKLCGILMPQMV